MSLRHSLLGLVSLSFVSVASPGVAPAEAMPGGTLQILDGELVPGNAAIEGDRFRIHNRAASAARVEFDLPRGEGLVCETASDAPRRARKFVVAAGDALSCASEAQELRFEVSRAIRLASGRYQHQRDTGHIAFSR